RHTGRLTGVGVPEDLFTFTVVRVERRGRSAPHAELDPFLNGDDRSVRGAAGAGAGRRRLRGVVCRRRDPVEGHRLIGIGGIRGVRLRGRRGGEARGRGRFGGVLWRDLVLVAPRALAVVIDGGHLEVPDHRRIECAVVVDDGLRLGRVDDGQGLPALAEAAL